MRTRTLRLGVLAVVPLAVAGVLFGAAPASAAAVPGAAPATGVGVPADGSPTDPPPTDPPPADPPPADPPPADPPPTEPGPVLRERLVIGTSVEGRPIVARRDGDPAATRVLVVLGQMHGDERAGLRVVSRVRSMRVPDGTQVWTIATMNPDGLARGTRGNARGVDLNRNWPRGWRPTATSSLYEPGRAPASEPETAAVLAFLRQVRPDVVVSFHQAFNAVDVSLEKTGDFARRLARWIGLRTVRVPCRGPCAGTMTSWVNARLPGMAITVELPARVGPGLTARSARAAVRLASVVPDA
jgi:murein peptide amidase A